MSDTGEIKKRGRKSKAEVGQMRSVGQESGENYQVRAVKRALEILSAFSPKEPEFYLSELSKKLNQNKSTTLRLLACLQSMKFLEQDKATGKYRLGIKTFEVGSVYYVTQLKVDQVAKPYMERLVDRWKLTANLAVMDQNEIVYVGIVEPHRHLRVNFSIGSRFGIHYTGLGKAMASQFSEERVDRIIRERGLVTLTPRTITSPDEFKQHLAEVRARGYAVDNEEAIPGVRCVAAPIKDYTGEAVAALSVSGSILDLTEELLPAIAADVKLAAEEISVKLGANTGLSALNG